MNRINKKIETSNKIYPFLSGLSNDLLFWAAINTIFLTTVKHFTASQVSLLSAISIFISILLQNITLKIIKKIGNVKSVRIGLIILLISSITITFGNSFIIIAIGLILYQISFFFKGMNSIILKRNLAYLHKEDAFIDIQSKSSMIYAISTMIISFIAGFLFNINDYLPMIMCIIICLINVIFSYFLYEYEFKEEFVQKNIITFKWTKILFLIILLYGLLYATLETSQENGKIFIQYSLQNFTTINQTAIWLSIILALSRISRVLSNMFFGKIYKKFKSKFIFLLNFILIVAILLLIIGNLIPLNIIKITVMTLGFCMILYARDPIMIFFKNELLNNCNNENQQNAMLYFNLSRKIVRCILATLISLLLLKLEIIFIMIFLLILISLYTFFVIKLYKLIKINNK